MTPQASAGSAPNAPIDLRSDTVTRPDAEMRRAMAEAEVGDDVFGEDPTVRILEEEAAAAVGQEAAVFVPSGTMGNQIALHLHARPGNDLICEARCHLVQFEMGAMAALSGLLPRTIASPTGRLEPAAVEALITNGAGYRARTGLLSIENSHNFAGGTVYDRPRIDTLLGLARRHGLPVHLDGARIFNAATALGLSAAELCRGFDSIQFCLSKGLGAPIGSILAGSAPFVAEARRVRKMFGGGMRQVGVIAAAGLVALRKGPGRLGEDHAHARLLAEAVAEFPGVRLDPAAVVTNILVFRLTEAFDPGETGETGETGPEAGRSAAFLARAREHGVLASPVSQDEVRLVTHKDVSRAAIDEAIARLRRAFLVAAPA
jgi:threonine aldolase